MSQTNPTDWQAERRRKKRARVFDIRIGDEWVFYTNMGGISRTITDIDDKRIYYRPWGEPYEQSCLRATFRRWWHGAELSFATDWTNRSNSP